MNNHNKLLLTTIAAVGLVGLAGSSMFAHFSGPTRMGDAIAHGESHADSDDQGRSSRHTRATQESLGEIVFEQTFQNLDALEVQMSDADVILEESRGDQVTVAFYVDGHGEEEWARELFEGMEFKAETSGGTLYVEARDPHMDRSDWSDHRGFSSTAVIGIPRDMDLSVMTADGDITADRLGGRANLSSADGDVVIDSAEGETLNVSTADGDIVIMGLSTTRAQVSTADGDISLDDVRSSLSVSTGDGDMRITFSEAHEASISTGDGDVVLFVPTTIRATFRLAGEYLNIAPGMELMGRVRDDMIEGDLNGGGPEIEVRTGDGSITLRQHN